MSDHDDNGFDDRKVTGRIFGSAEGFVEPLTVNEIISTNDAITAAIQRITQGVHIDFPPTGAETVKNALQAQNAAMKAFDQATTAPYKAIEKSLYPSTGKAFEDAVSGPMKSIERSLGKHYKSTVIGSKTLHKSTTPTGSIAGRKARKRIGG